MSKSQFRQNWPIVVGGLIGLTAHAQPVSSPDAGALRQQIEQRRDSSVLPMPEKPSRVVTPAAAGGRDGQTVRVLGFRFLGHSLLPESALQAAVSAFIGRDLSFEELQTVPDAVTAAYRVAGRVVQVNLPAQDITDGVVQVDVLEAKIGGMRFETELSQRVKSTVLEALFARAQRTGDAVDMHALDRALLLADDLPGVSVAGTLAPGAEHGETNLVLRTTDELPLFGEVSSDNMGSRSTGSVRLALSLTLNSPTGRAELVNLNLMQTDGSDYGRVSMTVPVGSDGMRAGVNLSGMRYTVVNGPSDGGSVPIKGSSGGAGLELSYPWVRSRSRNVYLTAAYDDKTFRNEDTELRSHYGAMSRIQLQV